MNILQAMLDSSSELIVLLSKDHKVLARNKAAVKLLQLYFSESLKVGDDYRDFVILQNMQLYLETFDRAIAGETVTVQNETVSDKAKHWFEYKMSPLFDEATLLGITFTATSIDDQKKAQIALQYLADTYEAIVQNTTEAIALLDKEMRVLQYNKFATKQLQLNFGKAIQIGEDFRNYVYPDLQDEFEFAFKNVLNRNNWEKEYVTSNVKDETVWIRVRMYPVINAEEEVAGVALFVLNILQQRKTELHNQLLADRLKDISWQHSHVIRAPVANILGIMKVLMDDSKMPDKEKQEWYSYVVKCTEELDNTIRVIVNKAYYSNLNNEEIVGDP